MKNSALTIPVFLAMGSVASAVSLGLRNDGAVSFNTGLQKFTLQATGTGINNMSKFTIANAVNQYLDDTEWLGDGSASVSDEDDSYVIFGDLRIDGYKWIDPDPTPSYVTEDTGEFGPGTLNNYDATGGPGGIPTWDAYLKTGVPSTTDVTHDLIRLVVAGADEATAAALVSLNVTLTTLTGFTVDPITGAVEGGVTETFDYPWPAPGGFTWNTDVDGSWTTAVNWTPIGPPTSGDDATIDSSGAVVRVTDGSPTASNTSVSAGQLYIAGGGTLTSPVTLTVGSLTGSGLIVGTVTNIGGSIAPGIGAGGATAVPEPCSTVLLTFGALALAPVLARRRTG